MASSSANYNFEAAKTKTSILKIAKKKVQLAVLRMKQAEERMNTAGEEVFTRVRSRKDTFKFVKSVVCVECGQTFPTEESHFCHSLECGEVFYMLDDSFHQNLEDEAFDMSSTDISTCSMCTTEVTTEFSSESEVDESNRTMYFSLPPPNCQY